MSRRRSRRGPGRPSLLNSDTEKALVDATRAGVPVAVAAAHAGVHEATFVRWLARGRDEQADRDDGGEAKDSEQPYVDLYAQIMQARAAATSRSILLVHKAAQGGAVTEETVKKYRDPESGQLVSETTVKRSAPDWRAAAWYLERQARAQFGKDAAQVEISGPDGGPVQVASVDAEAVAQRVAANMRALTEGASAAIEPGEGGEVHEAEIVE